MADACIGWAGQTGFFPFLQSFYTLFCCFALLPFR